jgi:hypothetical protein
VAAALGETWAGGLLSGAAAGVPKHGGWGSCSSELLLSAVFVRAKDIRYCYNGKGNDTCWKRRAG